MSKLRIQSFSGPATHYVDFPEPVYSASLTGNAEFRTKVLRFNYTSLITPSSVFDYNMETRERELKKAATGAWRIRSDAIHYRAYLRTCSRRCAGSGVAGL